MLKMAQKCSKLLKNDQFFYSHRAVLPAICHCWNYLASSPSSVRLARSHPSVLSTQADTLFDGSTTSPKNPVVKIE